MKIGFDISSINVSHRTGIPNYIYELVKAVIEIDKEDEFVLFGLSTLETHYYLKSLDLGKYRNVELKIYRWPARFFRRTFEVWQKLYFPPIELFTGEVDIFHSFNWYLAPTDKAKSIGTVFDLTAVKHPEWHKKRTTKLDKFLFKTISSHADLVTAISNSSRSDFLKSYPGKRVEVIYPAVSEIFTPLKNKTSNRHVMGKYKISPGYILSVATLEPRKNLESLVKAYLEIKPRQKLVLVGERGWKNEELERIIENHKDRILSLGYIPEKDLPSIYQEALCLVYPSFYEGFGLPILEAMSCGIPVIISNTSSMPEVGGEAAIYIDPRNIDSIKKALESLINNPGLVKKYCKLSLEQAKKFSWEKSAKKLIKLYREA